jgi:hypothetical protein
MEHMFLAAMAENTINGGSCVRVVGLVKSSRRFRTSMRYSEHNSDKIHYLRALVRYLHSEQGFPAASRDKSTNLQGKNPAKPL